MKIKRIWEYIFITVCLLILSIFLIGSSKWESPTYDEITYAEAGYQFLVNKDFRFDPFSPPLAKEIIALPALINKNVIYDKIIFWPRMMVALLTVALAIIVYAFSKQMFGNLAAKFALILYIFEPNILANGHYATADLIFTFFLILCLFCYWKWENKFTTSQIIIFASLVGLLLSTKITSIPFFIFPLLVLFILRKTNKQDFINMMYWRKRILTILVFIFVVLITLWSTYFFELEPLLGYRFDKNRPVIELAKSNSLIRFALNQPVPLGSYISTIKQAALFNYSNLYIKRSFFMENLSVNGSPGYLFPLIVLIKTPIPLLIIFTLCLFISKKKKSRYLLVPLIFILLNVLFSKVALVNRYILPIYPLIIIYSSQIINLKIVRRKIIYLFLGIMLIWYIGGTVREFPHFISYMNELVGGSKNRYKYLIDANYDWGQGLIDLKNYQDNNKLKNLQFAYFGSTDPAKYGIRYEKIKNLAIGDKMKESGLKFDKDHAVAISATCWYFCGYYKNTEFNNVDPVEIVGGSILIFRKD